MPLRALLFVVALACTAAVACGAAIPQLPFTINKPGQYTLLKSLRYNGTGNAITIAADDVTIDLRGFAVEGDAAKAVTNQTAGIAGLNRKNVTIRNGTVRGFFRGIYLEGGADAIGGHLAEDVRVDSCALLGIQVKGRHCVIRRNRVTQTGSATTISSIRYGIFLEGQNSRVEQNEVQDVRPFGSAGFVYGILAFNSPRATIVGNRVQQLGNDSINGYGVHVDNSPVSMVEGNQISSFHGGILFTSSLGSKYRDNLCTDCTGSYSGGLDAGNNQ